MPRDTCPASPFARAVRAVLAAALAILAGVTAGAVPWLAILFALAAAAAAIGAITGHCPVDFVRRDQRRARNTLGIAEARQHIDVRPKE